MGNSVSCGREKKRTSVNSPPVQMQRRESAVERTAAGILLFGAVVCTAWLCHFPVQSDNSSRGAAALSEYEVVEVFGEFTDDIPTAVQNGSDGRKQIPQREEWTVGAYFREFFSALLGT